MWHRCFILPAIALLLVSVLPFRAEGQTLGSLVTLSCNDGHSVIFNAVETEVMSLLADVLAINASGTGTNCGLNMAAADPSGGASAWTVYDYNSSNREISPRNSPNSMPATTTDGGRTWQFPFLVNTYTALFTTSDPHLTGNLSTATISDTITLSGPATTFATQGGGGDCVNNTPAAVRFFFRSPSASGSGVGTPPKGFYTQFWWSNPVNLQLISGSQSGTISVNMFDPSQWSDWNGQRASDPAVTGAFLLAIQNVQTIGLSFGGECFFETGVTAVYSAAPPPYETFSSQFSEIR